MDFTIVKEELYDTFSIYSKKSKIEGCPCCISDSDKSTLHSKQLRDLEDEDLEKYAFKAMTTWGDVDDFKHYLPRIFELAANRELIVDTTVILAKLDYGNWLGWDENEQLAIVNFLKVWWSFDINTASSFDEEILIELLFKIEDLKEMLNVWNLGFDTQGFLNFLDFIENHYNDLKHSLHSFKGLSKEEVDTFIHWIQSKKSLLEEGFFKMESTNKAYSERISNTLYILEH